MFKQILAALLELDTDIVYFTEHDVLYHPSYFDFTPLKDDTYYYNLNVWQVRSEDGHALFYETKKLSQMCCYRKLAIDHYKKRVAKVDEWISQYGEDTHELHKHIRDMGFEPGTHKRQARVDDFESVGYMSKYASIDIRHNNNLTSSRWSQEQFKDQRNCQGWLEAEGVPGWGRTKDRFNQILESI